MATLAQIWKQNRDAKKSRKRKWDELNESKKDKVRKEFEEWKESMKKEHEVDKAYTDWTKKLRALPPKVPQNEGRRFRYEFIGECYLHDMMDGEAMQVLNSERPSPRVFEIR